MNQEKKGFQGLTHDNRITTLGRGGSDTTAVAIAAALKAARCDIYTDVDGVYTTDPILVKDSRLLKNITFEEMLELSSLGAKVLQIRAVEFAGKYKVPLRVLSAFKKGPGTLINIEENSKMEEPAIAGIAFERDEAKLTVAGVPDIPGMAYKVIGPVSDAGIEVDVIVQNVAEDNSTDFTGSLLAIIEFLKSSMCSFLYFSVEVIVLFITLTASTGYLPIAVSADSMTTSAP